MSCELICGTVNRGLLARLINLHPDKSETEANVYSTFDIVGMQEMIEIKDQSGNIILDSSLAPFSTYDNWPFREYYYSHLDEGCALIS